MEPSPGDGDAFGQYGVPAHVIQKSSRDQIRIGLNEFKGSKYIDIRQFFHSDDGWRPTSKGVTLSPTLYSQLLKGVLELGGQLGVISQETLADIERESEQGSREGEPSGSDDARVPE